MIKFGHRFADIQDYTLDQIQLFGKAAMYLELESKAESLQVTALGAQGSNDGISKQVKSYLDLQVNLGLDLRIGA